MDRPQRADRLARLVADRLGLDLDRGGIAEALASYAEHAPDEIPAEGDAPAFQRLVDAVTVQHSWLFRDAQQLDAACAVLRDVRPAGAARRIWVPACATGEDVWSIAAIVDAMGLTLEVLGTDVSAAAVEAARRARYGPFAVREVPAAHAGMLTGAGADRAITPRLRAHASFAIHNLLDPPPRSSAPDGLWDLIVCRNVLIYFARPHAARALAQLASALAPQGALVLGASDILTEAPADLTPREIGGRVIFQRLPPAPPAPAASTRPPPPPRPSPPPAILPAPPPPPRSPRPAIASAPDGDVDQAVTLLHDGIARHLGGDLEGAVQRLRAALYLLPDLWPASYYLGLTYEALGCAGEARRSFAEAGRAVDAGAPLPAGSGPDLAFAARDIADLARRRARGER